MFDSALELITQAASNSLFVFCCCNLIIVMIIVGSKPRSRFEQGRESSTSIPVVTHTYASVAQVTNSVHSVYGNNKGLVDVKEASNAQEAAADNEEETSHEFGNDHEETINEDGNKEDDEFRRRVEAFIDEVNKGWKAELLRTSRLV